MPSSISRDPISSNGVVYAGLRRRGRNLLGNYPVNYPHRHPGQAKREPQMRNCVHRGIPSFRVRSFGPSRNDGELQLHLPGLTDEIDAEAVMRLLLDAAKACGLVDAA